MELAVSLEGGFIRLGDTVHIGEKGFKVIKIDADRDRINALPIQSALNKTRSTSVTYIPISLFPGTKVVELHDDENNPNLAFKCKNSM